MSDFKCSCPNCGQHIAYDESHFGAQINCPTCRASIKIPAPAGSAGQASAGQVPPSVNVPGGLKVATPPPVPIPPRQSQPPQTPGRMPAPSRPDKNTWLITWVLSVFLGGLGIDRFYNGRTWLGIGKLLACFLTGGSIGLIWAMIDFILLLAGKYRNASGNYVLRPKGKYMTLQVIGIFFVVLYVVVILLFALWICALIFALIRHSNFQPN